MLLAASAFTVAQAAAISVLPAIQEHFDASTTSAAWVFTLTLIAATVTAPILGRFGDTHGRRRLLVGVVLVVAIGSVLCALASDLATMLVGRALQGVGGATFGLALGIVRDQASPAHLARGVAAITASLGIGVGAGVAAGGWMTDRLGYASVFWLVGALAALAAIAVPLVTEPTQGLERRRMDWAGAALLAVALAALMLAISEARRWATGPTLAVAATGALTLLAWIALERSRDDPLVDVRLMARPATALVNLCCLVLSAANFFAFVLVPLLAEHSSTSRVGLGLDATGAGLLFAPYGGTMVVAGLAVGALSDRGRSRGVLIAGTGVAVLGLLVLALGHGTAIGVAVSLGLLGAGVAMAYAGMGTILVQDAPASQTAVTIGVNAVTRTAGGALGAQLAAAALSQSATGFTVAFAVATALAVLALGLAASTLAAFRSG